MKFWMIFNVSNIFQQDNFLIKNSSRKSSIPSPLLDLDDLLLAFLLGQRDERPELMSAFRSFRIFFRRESFTSQTFCSWPGPLGISECFIFTSSWRMFVILWLFGSRFMSLLDPFREEFLSLSSSRHSSSSSGNLPFGWPWKRSN